MAEEDHPTIEPCDHVQCSAGRTAALVINSFVGVNPELVGLFTLIADERGTSVMEAYHWTIGFLEQAIEDWLVLDAAKHEDVDLELQRLLTEED